MIAIRDMNIPESCEDCGFCTQDGDCMAMMGDSLWEYLPPEAQYFPDGWKYSECPLIDLSDDLK